MSDEARALIEQTQRIVIGSNQPPVPNRDVTRSTNPADPPKQMDYDGLQRQALRGVVEHQIAAIQRQREQADIDARLKPKDPK